MKERPILFAGPMVRALLAGTKTQTRRICKPATNLSAVVEVPDPLERGQVYNGSHFGDECGEVQFACPYGGRGDRLWVRETFCKIIGQSGGWIETDYQATYTHGDRLGDNYGIKKRWTPSIHMPRDATSFARLVNVWERASSIGAREAINFVGLAWRDGRPVVNEGPDCFFTDARQQCPYADLVFPSGTLEQAREVLAQFQRTFKDNAAMIPLVWGLGAHLKAFLGFWPHFVMQAEKGTGKSTLVKRLERAIAMVMSSRQSLQTEFRQLTSVSYTSHPVGWGEMSANKQDIINKAIHNLQECYQYEHTRRGAELIDYLLCAPVLLAGEDVPVQSLQGKVLFVSTRNSTVSEHAYRGEERRLSRQSVHDLVQAYGTPLGIPAKHLHPHAMRHLYGTELTEGDVPTLSVQDLMGHADPKSSAVYTALSVRKKTGIVDTHSPLAKMRTPVSEMLKRLPG